jgi:hypothetical protein
MFKNVPDPKAKRGAIQKSMLILSRYPYFDLFEPILREAIGKYIVNTFLSLNCLFLKLYISLRTSVQMHLIEFL